MNRLFLALAFLAAATLAPAKEVPYLSGRVVDEARMLTPRGVATLEVKLKDYEASGGTQIVLLTVESLEGEEIEEFANDVFHTWKLGQKGKDNGVLLVLAREERRSRIEVGYGLEGNLNDGKCGRILRQVLAPRLRAGDFDLGLSETLDAIIAALGGEEIAEHESGSRSNLSAAPWPMKLAFGVMYLVVVGIFSAIGLFAPNPGGIFLYFFLMPFHLLFPMIPLGPRGGIAMFGLWALGWPITRAWLWRTPSGRAFRTRHKRFAQMSSTGGGGGFAWSSGSDSGGSWGSSDSGGFSGGGGDSGGGGASGGW